MSVRRANGSVVAMRNDRPVTLRPDQPPDPIRVASSDGVTLGVHDLGGSGPLLIMAHATGFHGWVWAPVAATLTERFHCVAPDMRAHGDSNAPDGPIHWDGFAADVLAVVDHFGPTAPVATGHSKGAAALLLAEEARPQTFRRLVLFEPIVFPVDPPPGPSDFHLVEGALRRRAEFPSRDAALANFAAKPPFDSLHPDALTAYVEHGFVDVVGGVRLKCEPEDEADTYRHGSAHAAYLGLDAVECPVLLVHGEHTDAMGAPLLEMLADRLPDGEVRQMDGVGHFGPLEDPAGFASIVAGFLDE